MKLFFRNLVISLLLLCFLWLSYDGISLQQKLIHYYNKNGKYQLKFFYLKHLDFFKDTVGVLPPSTCSQSTSRDLLTLAREIPMQPIFVTFTNYAAKDFVKSMICNLDEIGAEELQRLLVITSECHTMKDLKIFRPNVRVAYEEPEEFSDDIEVTQLEYGSTMYEDFIEFRTRTILKLLEANISIILADSDHYWFRSLMPWMAEQSGYDLIAERTDLDRDHLCAGLLMLNATPVMVEAWRKVYEQTKFFRRFSITTHINEQTVLNHIVFGHHDHSYRDEQAVYWEVAESLFPNPKKNLTWQFFPDHKVVPGLWYWGPEDPLGYSKLEDIWTVHNNFLTGNKLKILRAQEAGHWRLDENGTCLKDSIEATKTSPEDRLSARRGRHKRTL